ncbi:hypothetical protein [Stappia sp. ES.058]|uniref:hypothetical protein n=1 Tax=Stappia sp. ES.058 TaxID=1881061 RepID=UPI00087B8CF0|nr:hypothetical protein [Stappia sp. ES.058]SDU37863.1 hypothetical protein SAMN05428979_3337 [Stappia sp. ES.058]
MNISRSILKRTNEILDRFGKKIVSKEELVDFYLHEYDNYEQYKQTQIQFNKKKIERIWSDETTLSTVADTIKTLLQKQDISGICHGSRNGFEQSFFRKTCSFDCIGTDISETANQFDHSVEWDFHDENPDWIEKFDFVYSNSLDQSWKPRQALTTWLAQVQKGGVVVLEHTEAHGPKGSSQMDPFGVRPNVMPYVLCDWFGFDISVMIKKTRKKNMDMDAWLFFIKKLV